jgi:hypothetical protein
MNSKANEIDRLLKENNYKFLGWQNGWDYQNKLFPNDYNICLIQKHKLDEIQHNSRGSENTVSCDICKIYWKYDCSD